jgi:lysophospholipase L1-like esterase
MRPRLLPLAIILTLAGFAQTPAAPSTPKKVRIILVGDSTMQPKSGYGPGFCADMTAEVDCVNVARGGRSSGSYRAEGLWDKVMESLAQNSDYKATYVLIQFGHNDQPGKPGRSTDLATEFPANMKRYAEEVKAKDAIPILVTPLSRRQWNKDGKFNRSLEPWAEATRKVAAETHSTLIDLFAESAAAVEKMGPDEANTMAQAPPPAPTPKDGEVAAPATPVDPNAPKFDYTHLGAKGSEYFGRMMADLLVKARPELKPYITMKN